MTSEASKRATFASVRGLVKREYLNDLVVVSPAKVRRDHHEHLDLVGNALCGRGNCLPKPLAGRP
jgi:hypothetical protein